ncbi:MAG: flavin monoamine oxidase family protein, partial [Tepidisphaeraceae bacterium]
QAVHTPSPQHHQADILVLGAGIAGLIAARALSRDHRVIVLEAQDRVGGRIHSQPMAGHPLPIELGPEFIHGHVSETFDLLKQAGLTAYELPDLHQDIDRGRLIDTAADWEAAETLLERLAGVDADMTFAQFLERHARDVPDPVRRRAIAYVEGFTAARQNDIGIKALAIAQAAEASIDPTQFKLIGPYDALPRSVGRQIASPSRIDLQTQVRHIRWTASHVEVGAIGVGGPCTYQASRAVIALPLGILQQPPDAPRGVRFEPEIPSRSLWRDHFAMGPVIRCVVRFREAFWESQEDLQHIHMIHNPDAPFPTWWTTRPLRTAQLTGWCGGAAADRLPSDEPAVRAAAIESLVRLFGRSKEDLLPRIETMTIRDWRNDPNTFGAYSYPRVGAADVAEQLTRPIAETLYFAGEHTDLPQIGTVAAAIASGTRAAAQIRAAASNRD